MKKLTRTLLVGSLALGLTLCVANTSLAQFGFFGHFGPHHHRHGYWGAYYSPMVYSPMVVESSTVVESPTVSETTSYSQVADMNPAPIISIQLVNPMENRVSLNYRLDDGVLQSLPPGGSITISQVTVISFDRGAGAARARYRLTDGMYKFVVSGGLWELVHQAAAYPQAAEYSAQQAGASWGRQAGGYANQQAGYSGQQAAGYGGQQTGAYSAQQAAGYANQQAGYSAQPAAYSAQQAASVAQPAVASAAQQPAVGSGQSATAVSTGAVNPVPAN